MASSLNTGHIHRHGRLYSGDLRGYREKLTFNPIKPAISDPILRVRIKDLLRQRFNKNSNLTLLQALRLGQQGVSGW